MKERDVVHTLKGWLEKRGCLVHKHHGTVFSVLGHPDLYGVAPGGRAIYVEVKRPGKKPNPNQAAYLERLVGMNAVACWADSVEMLEAKIGHLL